MSNCGRDGKIEIGIRQHEQRIVAAQLHKAAHETAGVLQREARSRPARERQKIDGRLRKRDRRLSFPVDDLKQIRRPVGLQRQFPQPGGGKGAFGEGLATTALPAAIAGPNLWQSKLSG